MSWQQPAPTVEASSGQVVFYDDFLGSTLDPQWIAMSRDGDQANAEAQWYLPANVTVSGSNLNITAKVQTQGARSYTSGMIQWRTFNLLFGTVEAKILFTGGAGPWPAFWMLGTDCQPTNPTDPGNIGTCHWDFPGSEEIDIAEITASNLTLVRQNLLSTGGNSGASPSVSDVSLNWHVYKLVWTPSTVTCYVDDVAGLVTSTAVPQRSMFLMLNVAVGGSGGGTINNGTLPQTMLVDYVKVTQG